ncbi:methyltransf_25 domain-containing protein [Nephila pilipes]|uniref:Methyltransf_25 domain-containing protein n=1 Tax=Nephila pilipes TaxID=299642 RepID=A0A8X6QKC2_NEPPI|nr:methyltransf_25 domain-containing protein [Nephila pilipes]
MYLDADLYDRRQPLDSVIYFLTVTLKELKWNDGRKNVVMDVGCGPGNTTIEWILPLFSNLEKLIALDSLPSMIEIATAKNCHPKVEYYIADFNDRSAVERWKGEITKLISVNCFHWLKDQEKCFQLVYDLLQPGGEAACYFLLESYFYDAMIQIKSDPKWKDHLEDVDMCIPESHFNKYDSSHYRKMVENIGFEVVLCQSEIKINRLPSHEKAKGNV